MNWVKLRMDREQIHVDPYRVLALLGASGKEADAHSMELIMRYSKECLNILEPCGGYGLCPMTIDNKGTCLLVDGHRFHTGNIILKAMRGAEACALFMVTAGPGPEMLSSSLMEGKAYLEGYIVDLIGSWLTEWMADFIWEEISGRVSEEGLKATNRYSPGYCNWDVKEQQTLFTLLGERCGIRLSGSSMMTPVKSVTGITGVGADVKYNAYPCNACRFEDCIYRRTGRTDTAGMD